jgi:GT2 family glycosyltransferase/glycosyltransferase involved in cell wall biosynthesis
MSLVSPAQPDSLSAQVVLFVSYAGVHGGAERLLVDWAGGLERETAIACPPGPLAAAAAAAGLRVLPLRARDLRLRARGRAAAIADLLGHAREIRALTRALEPELVVAWGMRSLLAAVTLGGAAGRPLAFQANDFPPGRLIATLVRRAATHADLVTAPSRAVIDALELAPRVRHRARVVAPGVDLHRFGAVADTTPQGTPEILVLGAIAAWKRPDLALEILGLVRQRRQEARLRVAGAPLPGDEAGEALLSALAHRAHDEDLRGAVEFAGLVADPVAALDRASLLLHCADREPFGIAVAEALAAGRPAVVPDSGGPAEIVDERCGRRYTPGDAAAGADAVIELLDDPDLARRLGGEGRRRAASHFERGRQQHAYRAALAPLLGRPTTFRARLAGQVALVTVTHNSAADLTRLLESVQRHLPSVRVVVADCASRDETLTVARARPGTEVLELANLGFGRACNRALAHVNEPVTIMVNPDVELIDDSLLELALQARGSRSPRLLAPRVLNPDGSLQDTVHPAPLSRADLARAFIPPAALPGRLGVALAPWRASRPRRVGWAVGCALAATTDTLRALGPFDERIFLYGEDMELALRAARAGIETWLWPAARVIHRGGHSIEAAYRGEAFDLRAKARHDAIGLARGRRAARLDDGAQALTFASRLALKRLLGRPAVRERRQLDAVLRVDRLDRRSRWS